MKILIARVVAFVATCLILYMFWSFAWMDFNPNSWSMGSRVILAYFSFMLGIIASVVVGYGINNLKTNNEKEISKY